MPGRNVRRRTLVMQTSMPVALSLALVLAPLTAAPAAAQGAAPAQVVFPTDRSVLPIPEPQYPHSTVFDVRNTTPPPRFEVKAPSKAPNVLIVLIDDMGFGQSSAFGGPIHMPTWSASPGAGCATTSSTPRRSARRPAPRC